MASSHPNSPAYIHRHEAMWCYAAFIKVFSGITLDQNIIDYLLGAFSLFPQLENIQPDYWLSPLNWEPQTLPKRLQLLKASSSNYKGRRF